MLLRWPCWVFLFKMATTYSDKKARNSSIQNCLHTTSAPTILNQVCGILDVDGYIINKAFIVREAAFIDMQMQEGSRIGFNLSEFVENLSVKDLKTVHHVTNYITGLSLLPVKGEKVYPLQYLDRWIVNWYNLAKSETKTLIAFKGGIFERNILKNLNIPYVDLESFGCPKYDVLKQNNIYPNCGFHEKSLHCALAEVQAFKTWILKQLR